MPTLGAALFGAAVADVDDDGLPDAPVPAVAAFPDPVAVAVPAPVTGAVPAAVLPAPGVPYLAQGSEAVPVA